MKKIRVKLPRWPASLFILIAGLVFPLSVSSAEQQTESQKEAETEPAIERIRVHGRRNMAESEISEATEQLLSTAGLMGDPINAMYSLPGVVYAGGDFGGEPAVRGSSPADNSFLIDGQPTGYLFHMFGTSIINEHLLQDFQLYPAAFGAEYGNATAGVFDVTLRDPKNAPLGGIIDLNMLRSSILVEGAITENQAFYAAYRRSTLQHFFSEGDEVADDITVYQPPKDDDYQVRYQWLAGERQKITFTAIGANDSGGINIAQESEAGRINPDFIGDAFIDTSFDSQQLRYEVFGQPGQQLSISALNLDQNEHQGLGEQYLRYTERQRQLQLQASQPLTQQHRILGGAELHQRQAHYEFDLIPYYCSDHQQDCENQRGERIQDQDRLSYQTRVLYLIDQWAVTPDIEWEFGLRYEQQNYSNESFLMPRTSLTWFVTPRLEWNAKAGRYSRFADIEKVLPKIGNPQLQSPMADHYALGMGYALSSDWHMTLEVYYKELSKLPRALNIAEDINEQRYASDGAGETYGAEFLLEKARDGKWSGWLSLSWSESDRTDPETGERSAYYLDTPVVINLVTNYHLNSNWEIGGRFTARSGARYTPVVGIRPNPEHDEHFLPVYGELNSETLPAYHRLDLEARYQSTLFGKPVTYTYAVLNAYGRKNISGYYMLPGEQPNPENYSIEGQEGMGPFPYIGMKLEF